MKRIIAITLIFALLLSGCGPEIETEVPPLTNPPVESTSPEETAFTETELYAVSVPAVSETYQTEDGAVLFSHTAQHMQLILPDANIADHIVLDFLNRIDTSSSHAESILEAAQLDFDPDDDWYPYFYQIIYSPTRIDRGVLSLFGTQSSYSGGLHGSLNSVAVNYDLTTGHCLTLGSIMHKDAAKEDFIERIIDNLNKRAEEFSLYEDFEEGVYARLSGDETLYEDFFFTGTGLNFFFSPYEIAPYAAGVISVEIPYSELTGLIYDGYFPDEREHIQGSMHSGNFMELDMERFSNMAEVRLSTGDEIMVVYPTGKVEDVRIHVAADSLNRPEYTIFAAYEMADRDAVVLSLTPEDIVNMTVSYYSDGNMATFPLA